LPRSLGRRAMDLCSMTDRDLERLVLVLFGSGLVLHVVTNAVALTFWRRDDIDFHGRRAPAYPERYVRPPFVEVYRWISVAAVGLVLIAVLLLVAHSLCEVARRL
jgi:hypothetical protein